MVQKLNENGVNICSITDHDAFDYELYTELKNYEKDDSSIKKVLPGVEFSVLFFNEVNESKVIHIVAIFSDIDETKIKNIEKILDENSYDVSNAFSEKKFLQLLRDIDIDTILIAHQKESLTSTTPKKDDANYLGEKKFLEFVYSDYFEAFEFKNKRNEVFNKNYIIRKDLEEKIRFVTGSDCHDWTSYPQENASNSSNEEFPYTYAKCLPTFKGLVMAMTDHRRLKRVNSFFCVDKTTIDNISLEQNGVKKIIPMSKGINVIIGDNSVGKSMLLHALCGYEKEGVTLQTSTKKGYRAYLKKLGVSIEKQICSDMLFCFDMQGEVRNKFESGSFNASVFLAKNFPNDIDPSPYRNILENEIDKMIYYLEKRFKIASLIKELAIFTIHIPDGNPESISFEKNLRSLKEKTTSYERICAKIDVIKIAYTDLLKLKLLDEDKKTVLSHIKSIDEMVKKYSDAIEKINSENERIESVANVIDSISKQHDKTITDNAKRESQFNNNTDSFLDSLFNILNISKELDTYIPNLQTTVLMPKTNCVHDYEFISKLGISKIDNEYFLEKIQSIFKANYTINWKTVTESELKQNLLRYDEDIPVLQFMKEALWDKFNADLKPRHSILSHGIDKSSELSSGMNSKTYFDLLSYETHNDGIYIIDQPEDNVSQKSIKTQLLDFFKNMSENRQMIIVTHNPQFIVNLDVDNVIYLSNEGDQLSVQSGALEYECSDYKMLDIVANNIDGGLDSIQKRWKRYEKNAKV